MRTAFSTEYKRFKRKVKNIAWKLKTKEERKSILKKRRRIRVKHYKLFLIK